MHVPFPFQQECVEASYAALRGEGAALAVAPTGSGKSGMIFKTAERLVEGLESERGDPGRVLILTHRKKLLDQLLGEAGDWTARPVGRIVAKGGESDERPPIVVAMVASAARRGGDLGRYDAVLIDECHHMYEVEPETKDPRDSDDERAARAGDYRSVIDVLSGRGGRVMVGGFTATDERAEGELDALLRTAPKHVVTMAETLAAGRTVPPRTHMADYFLKGGAGRVQEWLAKQSMANNAQRLPEDIGAKLKRQRRADWPDQAVREWRRVTGGKAKTLGFCDGVAEMRKLEKAFRDAGVRVASVADRLGKEHNDAAFAGYEGAKGADPVDVLLSVQLIGEGYNVPDTRCVLIECGRTTQSWYKQIVGRGARTAPGKDGVDVVDLGASSAVWGRLEDAVGVEQSQEQLRRARGRDDAFARRFALESALVRPHPDQPLGVFVSRDHSYFAIDRPDGTLKVFRRRRQIGRQTDKKSPGNRMGPWNPDGSTKPMSVEAFAGVVERELEEHAGWHAVAAKPNPDGVAERDRMAAEEAGSYRSIVELEVEAFRSARASAPAADLDGKARIVRNAAATAAQGAADRDCRALLDELAGSTDDGAREDLLYLAGVAAGAMAPHTAGEARKRLRAANLHLEGDLGRAGIAERCADAPGAASAMLRHVAKGMDLAAEDPRGGQELAGLATAWARACNQSAVAGLADRAAARGRGDPADRA